MSLDVSSIEVRALLRFIEKVRSPIAYKASCLIARGEWDELVKMKVDPTLYMSAGRFLEDTQVVSLLKKHPSLDVKVDRRKAAINSFFKAEAMCFVSNERLNPLLYDSRHYGERLGAFVHSWRKEIKKVLGRAPLVNELEPRHGPGSTFNNVGDLITVADKFDSNFTATRTAWQLVSQPFDETAWSRYAAAGLETGCFETMSEMQAFAKHCPSPDYAIRDVEIVSTNRFTSVPKTALTDRGICIEPSINVFYQLAVGQWISRRLKMVYGWDKRDRQQYHRWLARVGSLTGAVATIDLSMASDTVCRNLVRLLLPPRWFGLIDQLRCTKTLIDRKVVHIEKFSSMGNGYTFELETLLFYTLCKTIVREHESSIDWECPGVDVSVFGDDIIVPSQCVSDIVSALRFFGFEVNQDKTFTEGPFRESCGGDYFRGRDVRPHFQKADCNEPSRSIAFHNGLSRVRDRLSDCDSDPGCISPSIGLVANSIPRRIRSCRGPVELGDLVLRDDNPSNWDTTTRSSIRYIRVWRPVPNSKKSMNYYRPGVVLTVALYLAGSEVHIDHFGTIEDTLRKTGIIPRIAGSYVSGYRLGRVAFS